MKPIEFEPFLLAVMLVVLFFVSLATVSFMCLTLTAWYRERKERRDVD